jgi:hypothetical protein
MLYVPSIRGEYHPFYIQLNGSTAVDVKSVYSVIVKTHDYPSFRRPKDPYKNDWKDEHGDDEYIEQMFFQAFTFKAECAMFAKGETEDAAIADLKEGITDFMDALSGGEFETYDAWTGFGFQHVRLSEFKMPGEGDYDTMDGMSRVIFTVEFKVNDPMTLMTLDTNTQSQTYGKIIEA